MKNYTIFLTVFLIAIFYYSTDCASEINNPDESITVIQKTDSPEDRKKIYETYRDKMGQDFIISIGNKKKIWPSFFLGFFCSYRRLEVDYMVPVIAFC
ncbi:MAG: hypothetical protein ABRQ37_20885 [Candidatus Eremiobacterota bacterium]